MGELSIPTSVDELTPEWLTAALGAPVNAVEHEEMEAGVGYMGTVARLALDTAAGPQSVIAKIPTNDPVVRELMKPARVFEREVRFYRDIAADLGMRAPRAYWTGLDIDAQEFFILMEDMAPARVGDQLIGADLDDALLCVRSLAQVHAAWWKRPELAQLEWMPMINADIHKLPGLAVWEASRPAFLELLGHAIPDDVMGYIDAFPERLTDWYDHLAGIPTTIVHFDFRLDNMFFVGDSELAICDFQASCRGGGVADLGYFLSQSVQREVREANHDALVAAYHDTLVANGVTDYSREQLDQDLRVAVAYSTIIPVFAVGTLDSSSERAMALWTTVMERIVSLVRELEINTDIP